MLTHSLLIAAGMLAGSAGAARPGPDESPSPPWQQGDNNNSAQRGLVFTEPDADNLADFSGTPTDPRLVLYVGGTYFFAMAPLIKAFEEMHPEYKGRIYWETIPPGLLMQQLRNGGTVTVGNMTWTVKPDVYLAGLQEVEGYVLDGTLDKPAVAYVTNKLTIMVAKENPEQQRTANTRRRDRLRL